MVPYPGEPDDANDGAPLDPAQSAALIAEQRARWAAATGVDARLLFGVWGGACLLGFGAEYSVATDPPLLGWPGWVAGVVFAGLLATAMVINIVHIAVRTAGVRGVSANAGAMYGWAWFGSFAGIGALSFGLAQAGASPDVTKLVMTTAPLLIVGALNMAGAAIWQDRTQFALGAWILIVTTIGAIVGAPHMLAVLSLAGGGGLLVGALADAIRVRRAVAWASDAPGRAAV